MINIGLNVLETDGKATPSIQPAPTSVTGFIIRAERGPADTAVTVTNMREFTDVFGGPVKGAYGFYAVRGFFENGGGKAVIVRVVAEGGGKKVFIWKTPKEDKNLTPKEYELGPTIKKSLTFIGPSGDATANFIFAPAQCMSKGFTDEIDLSKNNELQVFVNGIPTFSHVFMPKDFSRENLKKVPVEQVVGFLSKAPIPGVAIWLDVAQEGKKIYFRTDRGDKDASIEFKGSAASALGFQADTVAETGNVQFINKVSVQEFKEIVAGALRSRAEVRGEVTVDEKHIVIKSDSELRISEDDKDFFKLQPEEIPAEGDVAASASIDETNSFLVKAGYRGAENRGAWGNRIVVAVQEKKTNKETKLEIKVFLKDKKYKDAERDASKIVIEEPPLETFVGVDSPELESAINNKYTGSRFISIDNKGKELLNAATQKSPLELKNGRDADASLYKRESFSSGTNGFDKLTSDVQLICCPEFLSESANGEESIETSLFEHCETRGDRFCVASLRAETKHEDAIKHNLRTDKRFGAVYFPWIRVSNPGGGTEWVPPVGHVLGVYARTAEERGIWKAPAGSAAVVRGALDVEFHLSDEQHSGLVKDANVNCIRFIPGKGIVIDSSRSLSTNILWQYVNVRLLFNFVKRSLKESLRWVVQEPNNEDLWKKVKYNAVTPFLMDLWRKGAFGPGTPEQVFEVIVDQRNNTAADIQGGRLNIDIFFYPSRPAETIVITVGQQESGAFAAG